MEEEGAIATVVPPVTQEMVPAPAPKNAAALVQIGDRGVMLRSLDDLLRFGRLAVQAGVAPKGMSEGAASMAIQAGLERGLGPLGGLQAAVVINGLLSWRGQAAIALIQNSSVCKPGTLRTWTEGSGDKAVGIAVAQRVGYAEPDRREFSVEDARRARLWGKAGPWTEYPGRQLMWRALGFLARDVFPDVLGGFVLAEEAQDFEERPTSAAQRAEMLPPPKPDPLMDAIADPVRAVPVDAVPVESAPPVPVSSSPAEEPGAAEAAKLFDEPETVTPPGCRHPGVPPSRIASLSNKKEVTCDVCGESFKGEKEVGKAQAQ